MIALSNQFKSQVETLKEYEIELPRVYEQPPFPSFQARGCDVTTLLKELKKQCQTGNNKLFGEFYNKIVTRFQPVIRWAISCWDYLLSTQGVRFLPRHPFERSYSRDLRAFTDKDYEKLVYRTFRKCVLEFEVGFDNCDFIQYFQTGFWDRILNEYSKLENPEDQRQRKLTPYSYLRCTPYQFLNPYHRRKVHAAVKTLPRKERKVIELYFLNFFKEGVIAHKMHLPKSLVLQRKQKALRRLYQLDYLTYALLLQIERY